MKASTKNQAQGMFHKVVGKVKEVFGVVSVNADLESQGKDEKLTGKVQQKVGEVEKVLGK